MHVNSNLKKIIVVLLMLIHSAFIFAEVAISSVNSDNQADSNKRIITYAENTENTKRAEVSGSGIKLSIGAFYDYDGIIGSIFNNSTDSLLYYYLFGLEGGASIGTRNFRDFLTVKIGASSPRFSRRGNSRFDFAIGGKNSFMFKIYSMDSDYNVGWLGLAAEYMHTTVIQHSVAGLIEFRGQYTSFYYDVGVGYRWHLQNNDRSIVINMSAGYSM